MEQLAQTDRVAAAEYAKTILQRMDSPDEWVVALRDVARADNSAETKALLTDKFGELLGNPSWRQNPSAGYLEAFDVPVYLGGTNFVPSLAALTQPQTDPALSHAAYLALDRLTLKNTGEVLGAINDNAQAFDSRPEMRANFFARADVRDEQQAQQLEKYLLDAKRSSAELSAFFGIFPNENFMISPNLLTASATLDHDTLMSRDAAALAKLQSWAVDPRFAAMQPALQKAMARLQGFVQQAQAAR